MKPTPTKPAIILASVLVSLRQTGCYQAPLSLKNGGEKVAASIGEPMENLMFVSTADMTPTSSFTGWFSIVDRGVFAATEDAIYWQPGQDKYDPARSITTVPFESVDEFAPDGDLVQLRINDALYVVRFVGWSSSAASQPRAEAFMDLLLANEVPQFTPELSFKPTITRTRLSSSARSLEADYQSDPDVGRSQDFRDLDTYDHWATFGDDGVVAPPP